MIRAVILDDEIRGSRLLAQKLAKISDQLEVLAIFNNPAVALKDILDLAPDVLFLDVEMPGMNAFQFLEKLGSFQFEVIFTTAYNTYTIDALRLSAVDYLLKPVDEQELNQALARLQKRLTGKAQSEVPKGKCPKAVANKLALPTAEGIHLVAKEAIIRIEAMSNYSTFILSNNKKIVVSKTLKEFEHLTDSDSFLRVNRSTILNLEHVVKYKRGDGGCLELTDGFEVEVSPLKKADLLERLSL